MLRRFMDARAVAKCVNVRTKVAGGPWFVELAAPEMSPLYLGPYDNPALARQDARRMTAFLSAVLMDRAGTARPCDAA